MAEPVTDKTRTFFRKHLNPKKQHRIEGQNFIDNVASMVRDLHYVFTEDEMWRDKWRTLKDDIRISQKSRFQADVALLRSKSAFEKVRTAVMRLRADCLYLERIDGLCCDEDVHEHFRRYLTPENRHLDVVSELRPRAVRQRDLLDLRDCVIKMREHNLELLGLCDFDDSQRVDEQPGRTEQQARLVLNDQATANLDPGLLSPRTVYEVNERATLNLAPVGGQEETRTTERSSESISSRRERKPTSDDMLNMDGKSVDAEAADDDIRVAPSVGTNELATVVGSQLSINTNAHTPGSHSSTAMARSTAQDSGLIQPDTLSTYQNNTALVPRLLSDLPAQRGTLQPAMATVAETAGKVMSTSSANTPDPTAVMITAGFVAGATGVNALATAINGNGTRKAAHRSADAAENNASYAKILMGLSLTEHDWKTLVFQQAAEEHAWKREEHRWKKEDRELQVRKVTLECRKLERELDDQPGTDGGAGAGGAASDDSHPGDLPRLIGAPPPPGSGGDSFTGPRVIQNESEDATDDGDDIDYPSYHPAPWIKLDVSAGETRTFLPTASPVLSTCGLSGKAIAIDIDVDEMASQSTTPIEQAEVIDEFTTTTAERIESSTPCRQDDERASSTPAVVADKSSVESTLPLPSRPDPFARKSPNPILARRSSETFGDDAYKMEDLPRSTAKIMEALEDLPGLPERVLVRAD